MVFSPHLILQFLSEFKEPLGAAFGGIMGWWGNVAKNKIASKRNEIDASKIGNETLRLALCREKDLSQRVIDLTNQARQIWSQFYALGQVASEYHLAALSARQKVNELENEAGKQITIFEKLPVFPNVSETEFPRTFSQKSGDQDATTADPHSESVHLKTDPDTARTAG